MLSARSFVSILLCGVLFLFHGHAVAVDAPSTMAPDAVSDPVGAENVSTPTAEPPSSSQPAAPSSTQPSLKSQGIGSADWALMILTLISIVGLIVLLAWLAKRFGGLRAVGGQDMRVLNAMPLGTREKLALVEVKGKQILIGVTASQISHLHTFSQKELDEADLGVPAEGQREGDFAQKLKMVLKGQHQRAETSDVPVSMTPHSKRVDDADEN